MRLTDGWYVLAGVAGGRSDQRRTGRVGGPSFIMDISYFDATYIDMEVI